MLTTTLLLCSRLVFVSLLTFEKPLEQTLWHQKCSKNAMALNDCNWCRCGPNFQYVCDARNCGEVDMFGHFNDAISNIDVGMEGHGYWRSTETPCEAGVLYRRGGLLCFCNEDGNWPNPVCRDIFRVLHSVENLENSDQDICAPTKLYLVGCNVCFCPSTGHIDPELCTTKACDDNDPVSRANEVIAKLKIVSNEDPVQDFYAVCTPDLKYKLGCQVCTCLRNNRLLCNNCTIGRNDVERENHCNGMKRLKIFNVECNLCYCDGKGSMVCTAKRCLKEKATALLQNNLDQLKSSRLSEVEPPYVYSDCVAGTKFKRGCIKCVCVEHDGHRIVACTSNGCKKSPGKTITNDCVVGTVYELNCLRCHCESLKTVTWQWCETESICDGLASDRKSTDLQTMHGYCEPLHDYVSDCNRCNCLADGKRVVCSDLVCDATKEVDKEPVLIDVIPVKQNHGSVCPKGHSYRINCNICFCLSNGNALCTTVDCSKRTQ